MGRTIVIICAILVLTGALFAQGGPGLTRKERKEVRREQQRIVDSTFYAKALLGLNNHDWVLEANSIQSKRGMTYQVNGITNFVMVDKDRGTVQLASPVRAGYNGLGGITLDGNISSYKVSSDKKGNVSVEFYILGVGINATIFVSLYAGSNRAQVTVSSNSWGSRITYNGTIFLREESSVFKGFAL